MIRIAAKFSRASSAVGQTAKSASIFCSRSQQFRSFYDGLALDKTMANQDAVHMITYALNHARTDKSVGSYGLGLLVLKHCLTTELTEGKDPTKENSKGIALLAMSTLLSERGEYDNAIEKLESVQELTNSFLGVRVAAFEAQVGLHLELGQDDKASTLADKCLALVGKQKTGCTDQDFEALSIRAKAVKGLVELVNGNLESAEAFFQKALRDRLCNGSAALSYGEFLHAKQNYSMAKEVYRNVIQGSYEIKDSGNPYLGAGNMNLEGLMVGAMCALGQLESRLSNFENAEELFTKALKKAEECYGAQHPKVGNILTSLALMYRRKAIHDHKSALLLQEGLYRKVTEILKAAPVETEGPPPMVDRSDILALARGGYAEVLSVQENRKGEGEKMKNWAEAMWRNRRLSLADALGNTDSTKTYVIDARISRAL